MPRSFSSKKRLRNASAMPKHCPPSSATALLPLGALLLAGSLNVCAQVVQDTPAGEETKTLKPVTISGTRDRNSQTYQSGVVSVGKTQAAAKDIPQSLTVVTEKLIHDEGKDTLKGALQNVPGITFEAGEGGRIGDNIRLRGFTVAGDIYLDGMRDIAQYNRDTFNLHIPASVDVKAIRKRRKMSQEAFAAKYGFARGRIRDWEQNRSTPDMPSRLLLKIIENEPEAVERAVAAG